MNEIQNKKNLLAFVLFVTSIALYWFRPLPPSEWNDLIYAISAVYFWIVAVMYAIVIVIILIGTIATIGSYNRR